MIGAVRKTHHKRQATTQPISLLLEGFLTPIAEGNGIKSGLETPPTRGSFLKFTLIGFRFALPDLRNGIRSQSTTQINKVCLLFQNLLSAFNQSVDDCGIGECRGITEIGYVAFGDFA